MKLNHDCIREVMLYLEENLDIGDTIDVDEIELAEYNKNDVTYSVAKLYEAGYISGKITNSFTHSYSGFVSGITWEGHKFLDTIRDNKVWSMTKNVLSKVSSASITFASTVASQILTNLISNSM